VASALEHIHSRVDDNTGRPLSIVHRDISPQNVMISRDGHVKVIDFGIAKFVGRSRETRIGVLKGKAGYMAPEQVEQREVDGRVDQFALGILLWELLCGRRLFQGSGPAAVIQEIRRCDIPPVAESCPGAPADLAAAVDRALAKDRDERFPDATTLRAALEATLGGVSAGERRRRVEAWMDGLFPEGHGARGEVVAPLSPSWSETAEGRGEETTDSRMNPDATGVFLPGSPAAEAARSEASAREGGRGQLLPRRRAGPLVRCASGVVGVGRVDPAAALLSPTRRRGGDRRLLRAPSRARDGRSPAG
jgi:hypothetical protein